MLKVMRDNLKKLAWVLWAVIAVFILLVFVDFGGAGGPGMTAGRDAAAWVGDEEISWDEFQRRHEALERQMREAYGDQYSTEVARQLQVPRRAIEDLINNAILLEEARRIGIRVTDAELQETILSLPGFTDEQGRFIGAEAYERIARANRYGTPARLEEAIRQDLLRQKLLDVLRQTVHVTEAQIERAYRKDVERAAIRYLLLPRSRFAEEARADREALEAHYQEHREEFRLPEQRVIDYLLVDKGLLRAQMEIPEEELRAYYEEHVDDFTREEQVRARHILLRTGGERSPDEARTQLEEARRRIEGGEDFAAVARELSDDPGSAQQGGDLGFFGRGRMTPEFEEAAFVAEQDELVGPVETPFGLHLIQVTDRREGGRTPFEEARNAVRSRLAAERVDDRAAELATEVRNRVAEAAPDAVVETMRQVAEENPAVRFETTEPFGAGDVVPGIGRSQELHETIAALEPGELAGGTVTTPRGPMAVRLAEVRDPRVPPLDEVEAQVRRAVEQERQQELARQRLEEVRRRLDEGATLDEVASELEVELVETEQFGQAEAIQGLGPAPDVKEAALAAAEGELVGPLEAGEGALLFEVTERKGFDPQELAERRDEIRERLVGERVNQLLSSLVRERRREMGVRYSDTLLEQFDVGPAATA